MLGKSHWFRTGKKEDKSKSNKPRYTGTRVDPTTDKDQDSSQDLKVRSVIFVENTEGSELAKRIKVTLSRIHHILGFKIKVVEQTGSTLKSKFSLTNLWEGTCSRPDCTTCTQGGDHAPPPCTKRSLLYENICLKCNPGAAGKEEMETTSSLIPSIYVG